ncbi:SPFH domain-containing protein [soil metagenome]
MTNTILAAGELPDFGFLMTLGVWAIIAIVTLIVIQFMLGLRYISNNRVGIVEKLWSGSGSIAEGHILALNGEAGYQVDLLRGGIHMWYWRWQYKIHTVPLVTVPQGKIGYVYARDGDPLIAGQTLGRSVPGNNFQDTRAFFGQSTKTPGSGVGQRGRQRVILREGVYAINLVAFVVITEDYVYRQEMAGKQELLTLMSWQTELKEMGGFDPVVIGGLMKIPDPLNPGKDMIVDSIGIATVQDGPSLAPGEIIAPAVGSDASDPNYHNNFQDPEKFLAAGGRRGRQYVPITDGTYFINRWFATIEMVPKTVVPIGYVGVVISYHGPVGNDISGDKFRHGERVSRGERGVWEKPLGPGKYPFNTYAGHIVLVPTTNFVLHWITGRTESHRYDEGLKSIDIVTKDAYEPMLPLSVVVHIDYMKAPSVIQRFGDVKKLITQTLDPMLSAFFRDVAHKRTMLELLQQRDSMQAEASSTMRTRFLEFDIECVDVLIGKPETDEKSGKIETLLEQLRMRQLAFEQLETFERQRAASEKLKSLKEAEAIAAKQAELTNSQVQIRIAENQGDADLARARKQAQQNIVMADAELEKSRRQAEQMVVTAKAESEQRVLAGKGEGQRLMQVGLSESAVLMRKIASYGDPRLYALALVAEHLSKSSQPLVPERVFMAPGAGTLPGNGDSMASAGSGMLGTLLSLLVAEKSGFNMTDSAEGSAVKEFADRMSKQMMESMDATSMPAAIAARTGDSSAGWKKNGN